MKHKLNEVEKVLRKMFGTRVCSDWGIHGIMFV